MITKRQKQVLSYISKYTSKHGFAPSLEEIKDYLKLSSVSTAHHHVKKLLEEGLIYKQDNQPRAVSTKENIRNISIPVLGVIAAGYPIEAIEHQSDHISLPINDLTSKGKHYALKVQGNSMIEDGIFDGDLVVIRQQSTAEDGQTVVAIIDDNQATLKKIYKEKNRVRLQPANQALLPMYRNEVEVRGVVVKIIRNLEDANEMPGKLYSKIKLLPLTLHSSRQAVSEPDIKPKPFLQWVGGKREMIPQYEIYFPKSYNNYFEPFLGGGAVFFHLQPDKAILADNNLELIKSYEAVRDNPEAIIKLLKELKKRHSKDLYQYVRNMDREFDIFTDFKNEEIAARMIFLNQTCFNGLYRVNSKGQFNVPIGSSLNRLICDEHAIRNTSKLLRKVTLLSGDFEAVVKKAKINDFVYLDPPYYPVSAYSDFTRYTKEKFYQNDQMRLKKLVDTLSQKGCKVMLSNSDCQFIRDLYSDYKQVRVNSSRSLNSKKEKRGKVSELLVMNY